LKAIELIENSQRIFFIGNGGSNAICSHMAEDFQKLIKYPTFCFSDGALITCFSNDYGYENAMKEWIKGHALKNDLLVAISSSGESENIINSVDYFKRNIGKVITLSGFTKNNSLSSKGDVNFSTETKSYGITECLHEVILHSLLDQIDENNNK
jgi:D-sedoheptulose 7-phosphate isomerase